MGSAFGVTVNASGAVITVRGRSAPYHHWQAVISLNRPGTYGR